MNLAATPDSYASEGLYFRTFESPSNGIPIFSVFFLLFSAEFATELRVFAGDG